MEEKILNYFAQTATPALDSIFTFFTALGEEHIYIIIAGLIYWNISKKSGFLLTYTFMASAISNDLLKSIFHTSRPFEIMENIQGKRLDTAAGFAFPSGHSQGAASFYFTLAKIIKKYYAYIIAAFIVFAIGISRLYLGVHWPIDVLGGWLIGLLFPAFLYSFLLKQYDDKVKLQRLITWSIIILLSSVVALILINYLFLKSEFDFSSYYKLCGIFIGFLIGFRLEETKYPFATNHKFTIKLIRYIIGIVTTIGFLIGLKLIFPANQFFAFLRYFIIGFWVSFAFPFLGRKVGLFQ